MQSWQFKALFENQLYIQNEPVPVEFDPVFNVQIASSVVPFIVED